MVPNQTYDIIFNILSLEKMEQLTRKTKNYYEIHYLRLLKFDLNNVYFFFIILILIYVYLQ